jgi:hypothetical protein
MEPKIQKPCLGTKNQDLTTWTKIRNTPIWTKNEVEPIGNENKVNLIGIEILMIGFKTEFKLPIKNWCSTKIANNGQFWI